MQFIRTIERPVIIAGPCSAETEEQVMETARQLKASGKVHVFRAGIWKPRTRPDSFEGIGEKGLAWVVNAGREFGLPVITEVANSQHVEKALKAGFTRFWIGARTTVNPFTVQEIADSLKNVPDLEIMVKNPIHPDVNLWIGAIERFKKTGTSEVHAIHRGFYSFNSKVYRNEPMWEIPIALKAAFNDVKLLCDPSHICGRRDLLADISQRAMDLIYDGLMIETHPNPDKAWSDAAQQITPQQLNELLSGLIVRNENSGDAAFRKNLESLRREINSIDDELMHMLMKRMQIVKQIGKFKAENKITILQPRRWDEIRAHYLKMAEESGLSSEFIEKYLEAIHLESIRLQTNIMNQHGSENS